jgi:hypothetical protein
MHTKQYALKYMAKIKTSALVADIKGTVGGNVFAANKGGNYVRRYKKPTNANTSKQQAVRDAFGEMAGLWRELTEAQRQSWIEGAVNFPYQDSLGETRVYSGQQLFNKLNNNLVQAGQSTLNTCPNPQSFPSIELGGFVFDVSSSQFQPGYTIGGATAVPEDFVLIVEGTTTLSQGISAPQKGLFKKLVVANPAASTATTPTYAEYQAVFGNIALGDAYFMGFKLVSLVSGEASIVSFIKGTTQA